MDTLLLCSGVFALSFLAIWGFCFVEKWRGDSAPRVVALAEPIIAGR